MSKVKISVVVPFFNEEKHISHVINDLLRQKINLKYEIILVNNNSSDKSPDIAQKFSEKYAKISLLNEPEQGVAYARQLGFKNSRGEIIVSTDADATLPENWLKDIWELFKNNEIVATAGIYRFNDRNFLVNTLYKHAFMVFDFCHWLIFRVMPFRGINFAVKKSIWLKAGGFSVELKVFEDVELANRISKYGKILYKPDLLVGTTARRYEGRLFRQFLYRLISYYYIFLLKQPNKAVKIENYR